MAFRKVWLFLSSGNACWALRLAAALGPLGCTGPATLGFLPSMGYSYQQHRKHQAPDAQLVVCGGRRDAGVWAQPLRSLKPRGVVTYCSAPRVRKGTKELRWGGHLLVAPALPPPSLCEQSQVHRPFPVDTARLMRDQSTRSVNPAAQLCSLGACLLAVSQGECGWVREYILSQHN